MVQFFHAVPAQQALNLLVLTPSQLILNAKCHAIRDAQLIEKVEIKKEQLEEEKRLDEMMEVERRKALQEYEEREKAAHFERLKGAQVLQLQITDNEQTRLLDDEKKDQETKVIKHSCIPQTFQKKFCLQPLEKSLHTEK